MDYQIEENEELTEQQLTMPLDGSVSVIELAQQRMQAMLEDEPLPPVEATISDSSAMPSLSELLAPLTIYDASPQAMAKVSRPIDTEHPLALLAIGQCYTLPLDWFSKNDLLKVRSSVGMFANRNGKRFSIISHKTNNILEIARIQ
jgi:hypothetical protein